jgi:hypothetical protein
VHGRWVTPRPRKGVDPKFMEGRDAQSMLWKMDIDLRRLVESMNVSLWMTHINPWITHINSSNTKMNWP